MAKSANIWNLYKYTNFIYSIAEIGLFNDNNLTPLYSAIKAPLHEALFCLDKKTVENE